MTNDDKKRYSAKLVIAQTEDGDQVLIGKLCDGEKDDTFTVFELYVPDVSSFDETFLEETGTELMMTFVKKLHERGEQLLEKKNSKDIDIVLH